MEVKLLEREEKEGERIKLKLIDNIILVIISIIIFMGLSKDFKNVGEFL